MCDTGLLVYFLRNRLNFYVVNILFFAFKVNSIKKSLCRPIKYYYLIINLIDASHICDTRLGVGVLTNKPYVNYTK